MNKNYTLDIPNLTQVASQSVRGQEMEETERQKMRKRGGERVLGAD